MTQESQNIIDSVQNMFLEDDQEHSHLLERFSDDEPDYSWVEDACFHGGLGLLVTVEPYIIESMRHKLLFIAIGRDNLKIVEFLAQGKRKNLVGTLEHACALGSIKVVVYLSQHCTHLKKDAQAMLMCFSTACSGGHVDVCEFLLHNFPISQQTIDFGISCLFRAGFSRTAKKIMETSGIRINKNHVRAAYAGSNKKSILEVESMFQERTEK